MSNRKYSEAEIQQIRRDAAGAAERNRTLIADYRSVTLRAENVSSIMDVREITLQADAGYR